MTTSVLTFTPAVSDGGKHLSCRGVQPLVRDSGKEDGWTLDIHRKSWFSKLTCRLAKEF